MPVRRFREWHDSEKIEENNEFHWLIFENFNSISGESCNYLTREQAYSWKEIDLQLEVNENAFRVHKIKTFYGNCKIQTKHMSFVLLWCM